MKINKKQLLILAILAIAILAPLAARAQIIELIYGNAIAGALAFILMFIVWILGMLFSLAVDIFIILIQLNPQELGGFAAQIDYVWLIVRDLCNMLFIIIMIVVAFGTILRIESYKWNKVLPKIIMVAILINFSKTIALIIIDASQVLMMTFVYAFRDIAAGNLAEGLGVIRLFKQGTSNAIHKGVGGLTTAGFQLLLPFVFAILLIAISILVLLVIAILLLVRIIVLWVLVAVSPIAYLGHILDATKKYSRMWWDNLIKYAMLGPALAFFLWFAFLFVGHNPIKNEDALPRDTSEEVRQGITYDYFGSDGSDPISFLNFTVTIILLLVGTNIAIKSGGLGAKAAGAVWNGGKQMGKNFMAKGAGTQFMAKKLGGWGGKLSAGGHAGWGGALSMLGSGVGKAGKFAAAPVVLPGLFADWSAKQKKNAIKAGENMWGGEDFFNTYFSTRGLGKKIKARGVGGLLGKGFGLDFTAQAAKQKEDKKLADQEKDLQEKLDNEPGEVGKQVTIQELKDQLVKMIKEENDKRDKTILDAIFAIYAGNSGTTSLADWEKALWDKRAKEEHFLDASGTAADPAEVARKKLDENYMRRFNDELGTTIQESNEYKTANPTARRDVIQTKEETKEAIEKMQEREQDKIDKVKQDMDLSKYVEKGRRILEQEIAELQAKRYAIHLGLAVDDDVEKVDKAVQSLIKRQEEILKGAHEKLNLPNTNPNIVIQSVDQELQKVHEQMRRLNADNVAINWDHVIDPNKTSSTDQVQDKDDRAKRLNDQIKQVQTKLETEQETKKNRTDIINNVDQNILNSLVQDYNDQDYYDINKILASNTKKGHLADKVVINRSNANARIVEAESKLSAGGLSDKDKEYWQKQKDNAQSDKDKLAIAEQSLSNYTSTDEQSIRGRYKVKKDKLQFLGANDAEKQKNYQEYIKSLGFTDKNGNADMEAWEKHWKDKQKELDPKTGQVIAGSVGEINKKIGMKNQFAASPPSQIEIDEVKDQLKEVKDQRQKIGEWRESIKSEAQLSQRADLVSKIDEAMGKLKDVEPENLIAHFKQALKERDEFKASGVAIQLAKNGDLADLLTGLGYRTNLQGMNEFVNDNLVRKTGMSPQDAYMIQHLLDEHNKQNKEYNISYTTKIEGGQFRQVSEKEHTKLVTGRVAKGSASEMIGELANSLGIDGPDDEYLPSNLAKVMFKVGKDLGGEELERLIERGAISPKKLASLYKYTQKNDPKFFDNLGITKATQDKIRRTAASYGELDTILAQINRNG